MFEQREADTELTTAAKFEEEVVYALSAESKEEDTEETSLEVINPNSKLTFEEQSEGCLLFEAGKCRLCNAGYRFYSDVCVCDRNYSISEYKSTEVTSTDQTSKSTLNFFNKKP